jgi:hypothetical protein
MRPTWHYLTSIIFDFFFFFSEAAGVVAFLKMF